MDLPRKNVFLYDGDCGVCNKLVNFVVDRDSTGKIKFASLHSEQGIWYQKVFHLKQLNNSTSIFIGQEGQVFTKSAGILKLLSPLSWWWWWVCFLGYWLIPYPVRDFVYDKFSKIRFQVSEFFGWKQSCRFYSVDKKKLHFLDWKTLTKKQS